MLFIDNKYTKWYYSIISTAQQKIFFDDEYSEIHHIVPKSLGGNNSATNLVRLTAREHYVCHLLLVKMTAGKNQYKMIQAASSFLTWTTNKHNRRYKMTSRTYEYLKQMKSDHLKTMWATDTEYRTQALSGLKKLETDLVHKQRMSVFRKNLWKTDDYCRKMRNRPKQTKRVRVDGKIYNSLQEAGFAHSITANNVSKRCRSNSKSFENWIYI